MKILIFENKLSGAALFIMNFVKFISNSEILLVLPHLYVHCSMISRKNSGITSMFRICEVIYYGLLVIINPDYLHYL